MVDERSRGVRAKQVVSKPIDTERAVDSDCKVSLWMMKRKLCLKVQDFPTDFEKKSNSPFQILILGNKGTGGRGIPPETHVRIAVRDGTSPWRYLPVSTGRRLGLFLHISSR